MRNTTVALAAFAGCALLLTGCAGTGTSKYSPSSAQYVVNQPVKDADCYDASVMLGVGQARALDISKKVLVALDSTIQSESAEELFATRNRHIGAFVGSGGEELRIRMAPVNAQQTFVTTTTKTGFVGGAGQKAWSCQMVDEMVKLAQP